MGAVGGGVGGLTVLIHLVNHLLQLLRCGVLAQHPHHLAQLLRANAAILGAQHEDVKGCLEFCVRRQGEREGRWLGELQGGQGSEAGTPEGQTSGATCQLPISLQDL